MHGAAERVLMALHAGDAVAVPLPSPLPYAVVAADVGAVNRAKGRPADQPLGLVTRGMEDIAPHLAMGPEHIATVVRLCTEERLNVFAPLVDDAPAWLAQNRAHTDGNVGLMGSWLPELRDVLLETGRLYVSSANPTGKPTAVTASETDGVFGGRLLVVDGDHLRDPARKHGSATIVRVSGDGDLTLVRHGVNDEGFDGDEAAYLAALRRPAASRP
ncbi:Sua5/YciO/YrdC/YwlC family protein [Streptomyces sp. TS71-3]|uniref:Sua5/YciO/YrdC/YwlC family protein n=1 Tax=Streptomyces sp. TS71-3 TaxID=2733862 RepID=UPI001BB44DEC|nr:Sua5/YciO/YrdC/YwlC family protein [Streptomyces sp. TS71-3]